MFSRAVCTDLHIHGSHLELVLYSAKGFPGGSDGKESACNAGHWGSIPGWGRFLGGGNGYSLQCSCLGNFTDRGAWWAIQSMGLQRGGHNWATNKGPHPGIDQTQLLYKAVTRAVSSGWTMPGCFNNSHYQDARQALPLPPPGWLWFLLLNTASQEKVYYFPINWFLPLSSSQHPWGWAGGSPRLNTPGCFYSSNLYPRNRQGVGDGVFLFSPLPSSLPHHSSSLEMQPACFIGWGL